MLRSRSELLSKREVKDIHDTSMSLLGKVGVEFPFEEALAVFRQHGVRTDGNRVFLSEAQVMSTLEAVPRRFTIHARNPDRSVVVGDGEPIFAPGYGAPFLVEPKAGKRVPTMKDYHNLAKLADALPNQDLSGHLLVHPGDIPAHTAYLNMLHANMVHSDKPFVGSTEGMTGARHTMEMASVLFGEEIRGKPVTVALINSLSPLGYSIEMLQALMEYARWQQPVVVAALAMAGLSAPITLAGLLAMQNAEILAGIALAQLISPGTPVVFGSTSSNVDMRTSTLVIGSPELSLLISAHAQMARFYGLPSRSGGALTDASFPDAQSGYESMFSLLTTVNSGIDFVLHAAGILSSFLAFSYEKFVLDDEMCGMVRRLLRGISVTPETLANDVISRVGSDGSFLTETHTVQRCRTEFWQPDVGDRRGLDAWMAEGRPDAVIRAQQRWHELLEGHVDPPLDDIIARQLAAFVERRAS